MTDKPLTEDDRELLARIRRCEMLIHQSHARRDELVIEAFKRGITQRIIGAAFNATHGRVYQIVQKPFKIGDHTMGKRRMPKQEGTDVQKPT